MNPELEALVTSLESGTVYRFADWPLEKLRADGKPGVYTVWRGDDFIYVGISWKEGSKGLFGRLASHASGRRSGDQFCIYVCDLFIVPTLTPEEQRFIAQKELRLDTLTRDFVREHLTFRSVHTPTGAEARAVETHIRRIGLPGKGQPTINPL